MNPQYVGPPAPYYGPMGYPQQWGGGWAHPAAPVAPFPIEALLTKAPTADLAASASTGDILAAVNDLKACVRAANDATLIGAVSRTGGGGNALMFALAFRK